MTFEEKFIQNIEKYKLIYIYGDDDKISSILSNIRKFFEGIPFQRFELKDDISQYLLSNDMFQERKIFLVEDVTQTFLKSKKLFEYLRISDNLLIITSDEYQKIDFETELFLKIEAKKQSFNEKGFYIDELIKKNNLIFSQKHSMLIKYLLSSENFLTINNEMNKLRLLTQNNNFQFTDETIHSLFNLPNKNVINNLIEKILLKSKESFEILYKIIDKYDSILIIRSIYNYFLKLQKVFMLMMMEKKSFDVALTEQYGLLIGVDKNSTKNRQ